MGNRSKNENLNANNKEENDEFLDNVHDLDTQKSQKSSKKKKSNKSDSQYSNKTTSANYKTDLCRQFMITKKCP